MNNRRLGQALAAAAACVVIVGACAAPVSTGAPSAGPASPGPSIAAASPTQTPRPIATTPLATAVADPVLVGAGDIASCASKGDEKTADLLASIAGTIFTAGDNAYPDGRPADYRDCYAPSWGRYRERTRPALGNHDWETAAAAGFFGYFGEIGASPGRGWYSHELGAWHVVALDSNCTAAGGCGEGSPQIDWLTDDLADHPAACTLAVWHHPRWSSGRHGSIAAVDTFWDVLYAARADVVVNGHDHSYERFAPQDPKGGADPERGLREFVVGTGGASLYEVGAPIRNSEAIAAGVFGVLELTLHPAGYDWRFVPVAGEKFTDSGSAACH